MVYHKKHADISKTKNSLNGYFLKQLLEHFNERERASEPLGYPPPLSPNCWLKELDEVSNSKFFTKNIMIKNAILRHLIYLRDHYKNISDTCRPMHYTWFVNSFSNANIFCKPSLDYFLSNIHLVKDKYKTLLQRCTFM